VAGRGSRWWGEAGCGEHRKAKLAGSSRMSRVNTDGDGNAQTW